MGVGDRRDSIVYYSLPVLDDALMPKFTGQRKKSLGRSGRLWESARKQCLQRSSICWICAGECPDFQWEKIPFESAAIDMTLQWPHHGSPTADHVIPIKLLGPDDPRLWSQSNLRPAHLKCNSARGSGEKQKVLCKTSRNWVA